MKSIIPVIIIKDCWSEFLAADPEVCLFDKLEKYCSTGDSSTEHCTPTEDLVSINKPLI
jgi:hypothetical protein